MIHFINEIVSIFLIVSFHVSPSTGSMMKLCDFNSLVATELKNELTTEEGTSLWFERTHHFWEETPQRSIPETFILCSDMKNVSGFQRRMDLDSKVRKYGTEIEESRDIFGDVLYNANDKTCFYVSIQRKTAKKVASLECNTDSTSTCLIQPLLPMMKILDGTVDQVSSIEGNVVTILARLSSSSQGRNIHLDQLVFIIQNRSYEDCQEQLMLALPSSGEKYSCPTDELHTSFITPTKLDDSTLQFKLDIEKIDEENIPETLLAFLTGLAARQIIDHVEIDAKYYDDYEYKDKKS